MSDSVIDMNPEGVCIPISRLVAPLKRVLDAAGGVDRLPKQALATLGHAVSATHFGDEILKISPDLVHLGVLAIKGRGQPATYIMRPSASTVVHDTDLRSIPSEVPSFLHGAGIVEARRPETGERLWGDVVSIAWYPIRGEERSPPSLIPSICLLGLAWPDKLYVTYWQPAWTGEDLEDQLPVPTWSPMASDVEHDSSDGSITFFGFTTTLTQHTLQSFAREAARFLVVLGLLKEVSQGPLRFELDPSTRQQHVRLDDRTKKKTGPRRDPRLTGVDPLARVLGDTTVSGHLRRFKIGEGRKKIEWRYIKEHSARRWFAPRFLVERNHRHPGLANHTLIYQGKK